MKTRTKRALAILLALLAFELSSTRAAVDAFLKVTDINGETLDRAHAGSSDIFSWSWGIQLPPPDVGGTTKANFRALTVQKRFDTATPVLMQACASGAHYPRATFTLRKRSDTTVEFAHIIMEDVTVAGILIGLSRANETANETLSLNFARIGVEYFTILANGKPGERVEFAWNIPENKSGGVTFPVTDLDSDELPDDWERRYGLDLTRNDAASDADQDGATNMEEFLAGTNPVDPNQVFKSTLRVGADSQNAALTWISGAGKAYRILVSDELGAPFQPLTTVTSAGDGTTTVNVPADSLKRFFRVEVFP